MKAILLALLCAACAAAPPNPAPLVPERRWVEGEALPPHPKQDLLPDGIKDDERFVVPIEKGECNPPEGKKLAGPCPEFSGIGVSEARAARDGLYRIRYEELRKGYEADKAVWEAHRELYETQIRLDAKALAEAQPSWWERHDGTILTVTGFLVGALITLGITKGVNEAEK